MTIFEAKRQRRLHRILNHSTHLPDYKRHLIPDKIMVLPNEIAFKEILEATLWQRLLNWIKNAFRRQTTN